MNECENCGKKTRRKAFWGIAHCKNCVDKYNEATLKAVRILMVKHKDEFEKLRDKQIEVVFSQNEVLRG